LIPRKEDAKADAGIIAFSGTKANPNIDTERLRGVWAENPSRMPVANAINPSQDALKCLFLLDC
jgi:hypothetical protein